MEETRRRLGKNGTGESPRESENVGMVAVKN